MRKIARFISEYWMVIGIIILSAFIMCGCRSGKEIPIAHDTIYRTNTEYVNKIVRDSIYVHDSMWVDVKGDTIWIDRWHTQYVYKTNIDTLIKVDTIFKSKEIPIHVEKIKKVYLWWPSLLILAVVAAGGCYIYLKKKKRL